MGKEIGDIKGVSCGKSRFESRVNSVFGSEDLGIFTLWVVKGKCSWGSFWHLCVLGIEECSIDTHLEDVGSSKLWSTNLRVISGNSSEEWNNFLISIKFEIVVDCGINKGLTSGNSLIEDLWDDCALEKWDQQVSNLGNEA